MDATELVERARSGDRSAWAQIWDEHADALHRYARRLLDQDTDAADAVADTFVAAAENLHQLREPEALRAWLYAVCRREVQKQWRRRDRVTPVELDTLTALGDRNTEMNADTYAGPDPNEAAQLLWSAAEGLAQSDRELLALALANDLDSAAVARIVGASTQSVHVKVSRLKDSLGKAAGALLLARHHRRDCDELQSVLSEWDGTYTMVWRKRIARHVELCEECGTRQRVAAGALFSLAPLAVIFGLSGSLRESVLNRVSHSGPASSNPQPEELGPTNIASRDFGPDGWVVAQPWDVPARRRGRRFAAVIAAILVLFGIAMIALWPHGGAPQSKSQQTPSLPVISQSTSQHTSVAVASPAALPSESAFSAPPQPAPGPSAAPATSIAPAPTPAAPVPASTPTVATTATPLPTINLTLSRTTIKTSCGTPNTVNFTAAVSGSGALSVVIRWQPADVPEQVRPVAAPYVVSNVSFASISDPDNDNKQVVTIRATVTDSIGQTATTTKPLTVEIAPC
jgi:RNA polymerase sigma factor (sigma-70 family)